MQFFLLLVLALCIGVGGGLSSAWIAVDRGVLYGSKRVGIWTTWPAAGDRKADPYTRAMIARSRAIPLGAGEGLALSTRIDSVGDPLTGTCSYIISGKLPPARLWTLTVTDLDGRFQSNPAGRYSIHSREIMISNKNSFSIRLSSRAAAGNWLPMNTIHPVELVMRLYDTPIGTGLDLADAKLPQIDRESCQ